MLGNKRWLSLLVAAVVATFGMSIAAAADSASEGGFLSKINSSRAANGLAPLSVDGGLRSHARNHTADMIASDSIYHSSSGELAAAAGSGWEAIAENVGRGNSVSSLHTAFMNSSGHKKNILGDYNKVGIGVDYDGDGRMYVTVVFMRKGGTSNTTTTTQPSATTTAPNGGGSGTTAPKSTTPTTTTIPPTTTTTMDVGPDKPVTPGQSCVEATRFWQLCHD
jgi:opacity protein-like surface antigen